MTFKTYDYKEGDLLEYEREFVIYIKELNQNSTRMGFPVHSRSQIYRIEKMQYIDVYTEYLKRVKDDTNPT